MGPWAPGCSCNPASSGSDPSSFHSLSALISLCSLCLLYRSALSRPLCSLSLGLSLSVVPLSYSVTVLSLSVLSVTALPLSLSPSLLSLPWSLSVCGPSALLLCHCSLPLCALYHCSPPLSLLSHSVYNKQPFTESIHWHSVKAVYGHRERAQRVKPLFCGNICAVGATNVGK